MAYGLSLGSHASDHKDETVRASKYFFWSITCDIDINPSKDQTFVVMFQNGSQRNCLCKRELIIEFPRRSPSSKMALICSLRGCSPSSIVFSQSTLAGLLSLLSMKFVWNNLSLYALAIVSYS